MAGAGRGGLWLPGTGAFMLVLSAWVSRSVCLSLRGLGESLQHPGGDEATAAGEQRGQILFDGKDLELQGEPSSPAASLKLLKIILGQSTLSEDLEKESSANKEAAWKHLKPSLHCGQSEMEFRATGHRAAALQLDIGAADPLPLDQVPQTCGYTLKTGGLGFALAVSYDACNMIRENGNYVLKMSWLNASVEFICSEMSSSKVLDPYASKSSQEPEPLPLTTLRLNRHRRDAPGQMYYDPSLYYYYYYYYYNACLNYYYYLMNLAQASSTQTVTTAAPQLPTTAANPPRDDKQMPPYFPYYNPYYYQMGNGPVTTPPSSDCDTTKGTDQKPQSPQDPPSKTKWPFYPPGGPTQQGFPGSPLLQQLLQQHYGKKPHQPPPQTGWDVTGKPQAPTQQNPTTTTTTTTVPATVTATPCSNQERPIGASCLNAVSSYVPYQNLTFRPYVSYEGGKPAGDQQNIPQTILQMAGAHPRAFQNFESYASMPMSSAFLENHAVMNPWFYLNLYPHWYVI